MTTSTRAALFVEEAVSKVSDPTIPVVFLREGAFEPESRVRRRHLFIYSVRLLKRRAELCSKRGRWGELKQSYLT